MNDASAEELLLSESDILNGGYSLDEGVAPIRQYLLGALTPEERQQVEVRLLIDDEFHEQVGVIEDELIDEYLYGELSENERQKLGQILQSDPLQQRKLQLAEDLGTFAGGAKAVRVDPAAVAPGKDNSWWHSLRDSFRFQNPVIGFSLALALLLSVPVGVWALIEVRQLKERLARQEQAQPTAMGREQELRRQLEHQNVRIDELAAELQRAQEQRAKLDNEIAALKSQERPPANVTNRTPAPAQPAVASVFLTLMQSRGQGLEPTLNIKPGAARAQLILDLDVVNPAGYKSFKAEVYEVDGPLVESSNNLSRQRGGGGNRVILSLPASRLRAGEYRAVLTGLTKSGQQEPIGIYYFRVRANTP
jgi:hypothetical protein